jgi:hypothetical protein
MLQWNREGYGFRMRTITPSSIKMNDLEPLDVLRRGLPVASLTATRSYPPSAQDPLPPTTPCPLHPSAPQGKGLTTTSWSEAPLSQRSWQSDAPKAQTVGSLLRENIREYENIVDTIVQRTREQERIVREWDIEMERLTERQYRMNYDDVVREFNHKVREYCIQK